MNADHAKRVIPTADEEDAGAKTAKHVLALVRRAISKHPEIKDAQLGGSYAKGTWLAGETDIDVFVRFHSNISDELFRSLSRRIGFESMDGHNPTERYADHPYTEAYVDGMAVNVVPCYDVKAGEWRSAADRSPYHTEFMSNNLDACLKNDVRLLKKFLKVRGLYGAQIAVQGFSGYAAEVLIWHFGGFAETMRGMANIKRGTAIGDASKSFDTPVSIIDPIDDNRNLAAAVSNRNMGLFILACRGMVDGPDMDPLEAKSAPPSLGWESVASVRFGRGDENPEVIWGQARRAASAMIRQMERGGFVVIRHRVLVDEHRICLLFPDRVAAPAHTCGTGRARCVSPEPVGQVRRARGHGVGVARHDIAAHGEKRVPHGRGAAAPHTARPGQYGHTRRAAPPHQEGRQRDGGGQDRPIC